MAGTSERWYAVRLLFVSTINGEELPRALCEERTVLFRADSLDSASRTARDYGQEEAHEYANEYGETVSWALRSVDDVVEVIDPPRESGWEVMSRLLRLDELPIIREP